MFTIYFRRLAHPQAKCAKTDLNSGVVGAQAAPARLSRAAKRLRQMLRSLLLAAEV